MSTEITAAEAVSSPVKVFYIPSHWSEKFNTNIVPSVIGQAINRDGKLVGKYCGESLEEMRVRYPTVVLGDLDAVVAEKENMMRTEPVSITEQDFWDALECMPPLDWQHTGSIEESFKFVERTSGRLTSIYARVETSFWSFTDVDNLPHAEIMKKVKAAIEKAKAETSLSAG